MVIFQVLNEQNCPIGEYLDVVIATHMAKDLSTWFSEEYRVEQTEVADDMSWVGVA
jgi:hypothetical protein